MVLNIKNKDYELKFGFGFIRELDKRYETEDSKKSGFGLGIYQAITRLHLFDPIVLLNLIQASCSHLKSKPSTSDIEEFLEGCDIEEMTNDFLEKLKNSSLTKKQSQMVEKEIKQNMKN